MVESYYEIRRVIQWRDGAVYKTEHVEYRWVPLGENQEKPLLGKDLIYVSPSTDVMRKMNYITVRIKKEN